MDGVSVAASIVGIASAGVQISINLVALAKQISTASDRVSSIGYDISLTSGVLHQLGELMTQKTTDNGISIFSQGGLESTKASAAVCERIFQQVEIEAKKASEQLRDCKQGRLTGGKIKLSRAEKAKWPFLQPSVDTLRGDLREAKGTLMLILQVTSLALSKRMADLNESTSSSMNEQRDFIRAIIALQQQQEHRLELRGSNPNGILPSQQEVISATSPPRPGSADRTKSVDVVQSIKNPPIPVNASQTRASFAQASKLLYEPTNSAIAMPTGQESAVTFPALSRQDRPRDMKISSVLSGSKDSKNPRHTSNNDNDHDRPDDFSSVQNRGPTDEHRGGEVSAPNINAELRLFLLKPIVKDFFDKVELSWSVQNSNLQPLAIRKHMANDEQEGLSSVIEMLHQLHAYEQAMVDLEISKYPEGSVLYLRRTKTDIQHREMVFKAIPGLQFVVQHVIRSFPIPEPVSRYFGAPGGQLVVPMAQVPAPDQNTASPMAGCQICGTNASLGFRVGGDLVCNACWHVSRIQEHQQQQYQNALRSGQQQAQQLPQQHMRHSNAMHSGLQPAQQLSQQHMQQMSAQQTRLKANTQGQPALQPHSANQDQLTLIRGNLATAAAAQQQQQQIQAALLQQQPQQAQMQSQAYAAPQQLQHGQQGDRQRVQPQSYHTAAYDGHLPHVFTQNSAMFYPSSYTSSLEQRPLNPQDQSLSSMRPMSHSWVPPPPMGIVAAETPKKPQCWDHGCNGRQFSTLNDLYRHQQEELQAANLHESMPAGGSGHPMTQQHSITMHATDSRRERRMKRPRWMVGNDVEEAANEHAEAPVIEVDFSPRPPGRSSRRRTDTVRASMLPRDTPSPAVALPNTEEPLWNSITRLDDAENTSDDENEGNDLDGRRGDDVDVDAVVMKLLEKYTTLFDQSNRDH